MEVLEKIKAKENDIKRTDKMNWSMESDRGSDG